MTIRHYDHRTLEVLDESIAKKSPLEEGVYLIPANAYKKDENALEPKKGFAIIYKDGLEEYIDDHRGITVYYQKEEIVVEYLGKLKDEHSFEPMELSDDEKILEIKELYKSYYLEVFNSKLKELDYDSIATLTMWANFDGSDYQEESKKLLTWYEELVKNNYLKINELSDNLEEISKEKYQVQLPKYN